MHFDIYPIETAVALRLKETQQKAAHAALVRQVLEARPQEDGLRGLVERVQRALDRLLGGRIDLGAQPYSKVVR
jgi:hypothetical protein